MMASVKIQENIVIRSYFKVQPQLRIENTKEGSRKDEVFKVCIEQRCYPFQGSRVRLSHLE